jgi:hypothetical protein
MNRKWFGKLLILAAIGIPAVARADDEHSRYGGWYERNHWYERQDFQTPNRQWYRHRDRNYGRPFNNIDWRVRNGIRSGRLSDDEIRDLREHENDVRREEARYMSDGYLSRSEMEDLRGDYNSLNRDLQHQLNDGERRDDLRARMK